MIRGSWLREFPRVLPYPARIVPLAGTEDVVQGVCMLLWLFTFHPAHHAAVVGAVPTAVTVLRRFLHSQARRAVFLQERLP